MNSADVLNKLDKYSAVILAVSHKQFLELDVNKLKSMYWYYFINYCYLHNIFIIINTDIKSFYLEFL